MQEETGSWGGEPRDDHGLDRFLRVVYEAAHSADAHCIWLEALRALLHADMGNFLLMESRASSWSFTTGDGFDDRIGTDWIEYYQYIDPFRSLLVSANKQNAIQISKLVHTHDGSFILLRTLNRESKDVGRHVRRLDMDGEYYKGYLRRLKSQQTMRIGLSLGRARIHINLSRNSGRTYSVRDIGMLARVAPHMETAWRMRENALRDAALARSALTVLEHVAFGFAVVSVSGRIHHANAAMRKMFDSGAVLADRNGLLKTGVPTEQDGLDLLIGRTAPDCADPDHHLHLGQGQLRDRTVVIAAPLPGHPYLVEPDQPSVALFVLGPHERQTWPEQQLKHLFSLTPTEAKVATMLAGGTPTAGIAAKLDIRTGSARAHVKSILAKTGTHSQAELLSVLFQSAAYMPLRS